MGLGDEVGLATVNRLDQVLKDRIPEIQNAATAIVTAIRGETVTIVKTLEVSTTNIVGKLDGFANTFFNRLDQLANRFSLPVQVTIAKPGSHSKDIE